MNFSSEVGEALIKILTTQKDLLTKIIDCQKNIYSAVQEKDWLKLDSSLRETSVLSGLIEKIEEEKTSLIDENETDFYKISLQFPNEQQSELNELYRTVKHLALTSKIENDSLSSYVSNAKSILEGFFAALMPTRKCNFYNRTGRAVKKDVESLVLNQVL